MLSDPSSTKVPASFSNSHSDHGDAPHAGNQAVGSLLDNTVAKGFSAAAQQYKQYDCVQRLSAERLFSQVESTRAPINLLDIGCGPGTDFSVLGKSSVTALDIAPGMLQRVTQDYPLYQTVCADAQKLPFQPNQFDLIYSNLAMQWCQDLTAAMAESARVLQSGGCFHCAIVVDGSLPELKSLGLRHNQFFNQNQVRQSLLKEHWQDINIEQHTLQVHFDDLKALLYSIKGVGASTNSSQVVHNDQSGAVTTLADTPLKKSVQGVQLRGRKDWLALQQRAESIRQFKGIPLSYDIVFINAVAR